MAIIKLNGLGPVIPLSQVIFLVLEFFIGIHSVGLFLAAYRFGDAACHSANEIIKMEEYLTGLFILTSLP